MMNRDILFIFFLAGAIFPICSCKTVDKELEGQLAKQYLEIMSKEQELKLIKKDVYEQEIDDPTANLAAITLKIEEAEAIANDTTDKLNLLREEKKKLEKEFKNYQKRYPIREK